MSVRFQQESLFRDEMFQICSNNFDCAARMAKGLPLIKNAALAVLLLITRIRVTRFASAKKYMEHLRNQA